MSFYGLNKPNFFDDTNINSNFFTVEDSSENKSSTGNVIVPMVSEGVVGNVGEALEISSQQPLKNEQQTQDNSVADSLASKKGYKKLATPNFYQDINGQYYRFDVEDNKFVKFDKYLPTGYALARNKSLDYSITDANGKLMFTTDRFTPSSKDKNVPIEEFMKPFIVEGGLKATANPLVYLYDDKLIIYNEQNNTFNYTTSDEKNSVLKNGYYVADASVFDQGSSFFAPDGNLYLENTFSLTKYKIPKHTKNETFDITEYMKPLLDSNIGFEKTDNPNIYKNKGKFFAFDSDKHQLVLIKADQVTKQFEITSSMYTYNQQPYLKIDSSGSLKIATKNDPNFNIEKFMNPLVEDKIFEKTINPNYYIYKGKMYKYNAENNELALVTNVKILKNGTIIGNDSIIDINGTKLFDMDQQRTLYLPKTENLQNANIKEYVNSLVEAKIFETTENPNYFKFNNETYKYNAENNTLVLAGNDKILKNGTVIGKDSIIDINGKKLFDVKNDEFILPDAFKGKEIDILKYIEPLLIENGFEKSVNKNYYKYNNNFYRYDAQLNKLERAYNDGFYENGHPKNIKNNYEQGDWGNCVAVQTFQSLTSNELGCEYLDQLVEKKGDKYEVTLADGKTYKVPVSLVKTHNIVKGNDYVEAICCALYMQKGDIDENGNLAEHMKRINGRGNWNDAFGVPKVINALTGLDPNKIDAKDISIYKDISDALKSGRQLIMNMSFPEESGAKRYGLWTNHSYGLVGVDWNTDSPDASTITLKNPWHKQVQDTTQCSLGLLRKLSKDDMYLIEMYRNKDGKICFYNPENLGKTPAEQGTYEYNDTPPSNQEYLSYFKQSEFFKQGDFKLYMELGFLENTDPEALANSTCESDGKSYVDYKKLENTNEVYQFIKNAGYTPAGIMNNYLNNKSLPKSLNKYAEPIQKWIDFELENYRMSVKEFVGNNRLKAEEDERRKDYEESRTFHKNK